MPAATASFVVLQVFFERFAAQVMSNAYDCCGRSDSFFAGTHAPQSSVLQIRSEPLVTVSAKLLPETATMHGTVPVLVRATLNVCDAPFFSFWNPASPTRVTPRAHACGAVGFGFADGLGLTELIGGVGVGGADAGALTGAASVGVGPAAGWPFGQAAQMMIASTNSAAAMTRARRRQYTDGGCAPDGCSNEPIAAG